MIHIFQCPTEKNPTLGVTYHFFNKMEVHLDYKKFENLTSALTYLQSSKHTVLCINIEHLRNHCMAIFPEDNEKTPYLMVEAWRAIDSLLIELLRNEEKYQDCLEKVISGANFMRLLVRNAPEEEKPIMIMVVATILEFCKSELDKKEEL